MSVRLGIELTSSRCSLISVEDGERGSVVRDFHSIEYGPGDSTELGQELRRLMVARRFPQSARVVLWDARAVHLRMTAPSGTRSLEAHAMAHAKREVPSFRAWASNAWAGTASGRSFDMTDGAPGRELLFAAMAADDVRRLLKPFHRAGFAIEGVSTPVLTLAGLGATGPDDPAGAQTAFLAANRDGGALAIMRGGHLLLERRLAWDFRADESGAERRVAERYSFAARVAGELRPAFDEASRASRVPVTQVVALGDLPNLRSIAMPLIDELDVEVEALDSLAGLDTTCLPDRADLFTELLPSLRLAWAAAAASPLITLTAPVRWEPLSHRGARVALGGMAAAAAVVAAATLWPASISEPIQAPAGVVERSVDSALQPAPTSGDRMPPGPVGSRTAEVAGRLDPQDSRAASVDLRQDGVDVPPGRRLESDILLEPDEAMPNGRAARAAIDEPEPPVGVTTGGRDTPSVGVGPTEPVRERVDAASSPAAEPMHASLDARGSSPVATIEEPVEPAVSVSESDPPIVRSILYSRDRRLAIIGRQVVGVGDVVDRAVVVDITPSEVVLRLPSGERQRLPISYGSRDGDR